MHADILQVRDHNERGEFFLKCVRRRDDSNSPHYHLNAIRLVDRPCTRHRLPEDMGMGNSTATPTGSSMLAGHRVCDKCYVHLMDGSVQIVHLLWF